MKKRDLALVAALARVEGRLEALEQHVRSLERQLAEERAIRHCPSSTPDYHWTQPSVYPVYPMFPLVSAGTGYLLMEYGAPVTTSGGEG